MMNTSTATTQPIRPQRQRIAHITGPDGTAHRYALISLDVEEAREEARLLGQAVFGRKFTYVVVSL